MDLSEHNQSILAKLPGEYACVFSEFLRLTQIPRGSGNRKGITDYLRQWAEARKFPVTVDAADNVLIRVPATSGFENVPGVCLQGHTDMVCVKTPSLDFDFTKDPLVVQIDGGWIKATDTTLGADDGIGLALAMAAVQDERIKHGPIEILFTSDEEIGLIGASALTKCLQSKYLINLDSEDFGEICVSCAGGFRVTHEKQFERSDVEDGRVNVTITVQNYLGGHSGCEIHLYRANAIKQLAKLLNQLPDVRIVRIDGGLAHNAIPAFCSAQVSFKQFVCPRSGKPCQCGPAKKLGKLFDTITEAYKAQEPGASVSVEETAPAAAFSHTDSQQIIDLLCAMPHGPLRVSQEVAGFVETSFACTVIRTAADGTVNILGSGRSCYEQELDYLYQQLGALGRLAGWHTSEQISRYPGWPAKVNSQLVATVEKTYKRHCNHAKISAIHAGLEAGMICKLHDGMEAVSIGPTIKSPHSPQERCEVATVGHCYDILTETLADIASQH